MSTREQNLQRIREAVPELVEKLADIEHQRWADWHKWCRNNWTPERIERWDRQARTPYAELNEEDKEKDRREVMRYLPLILQSPECIALAAEMIG